MEPVRFNTGFIYEYGSDYIVSFGGDEYNIIDIDTVTWETYDIPIVQTNIQNIEQQLKLPKINFDEYEKNIEGTYKLLNHLLFNNYDKKYIMGCIIYHQLLYRMPLEAVFETGYSNSDNDTYGIYSDSE